MRLLFLHFFLLIFTLFHAGAQNKVRWLGWDKADEKINKADRKFMVYVYFDGCKWCRYMEDNTYAVDHLAKFVNQNFYAFRLNALMTDEIKIADKSYKSSKVGKYEFQDLAIELLDGNMSFPTVLFMNEKFKKIAGFDSYIEPHNFEMILSFYAGNYYKNTIWKRFASNYCRDNHFNSLVNDKK